MDFTILFVDDEPNVINGLKRMLFSMRKSWNMLFSLSGEDALKKIAETPVDVIVTDMRMPNMDGAELLEIVKTKYPNTIRIILSGHSDKEMAIRSTRAAHQFIAKPCDAETLKNKISKTIKLRQLLTDDNLLEVVNGIGELPSLPETYVNLDNELKKRDVSINNIGQIVSKDITMSAKILQLVNSAFFGLPSKVTNPVQAVNLLGVNIIKSLLLYVGTFGNAKLPEKSKFYLETLWEHSFMVGNICKFIAKHENLGKEVADDAYTAGILHDIGKLILLRNTDYYEKIFAFMETNKLSFIDAEKEVYKATHTEIGSYLLGIWGLPESIVEAVLFHHNPGVIQESTLTILTILHLANKISILKICGDLNKPDFDINDTGLDVVHISKFFDKTKLNSLIQEILK